MTSVFDVFHRRCLGSAFPEPILKGRRGRPVYRHDPDLPARRLPGTADHPVPRPFPFLDEAVHRPQAGPI